MTLNGSSLLSYTNEKANTSLQRIKWNQVRRDRPPGRPPRTVPNRPDPGAQALGGGGRGGGGQQEGA